MIHQLCWAAVYIHGWAAARVKGASLGIYTRRKRGFGNVLGGAVRINRLSNERSPPPPKTISSIHSPKRDRVGQQ